MESKEIAKKMTAVNNGFLHLLINIALLALALWLCIEASENTIYNNSAMLGILGGVCWVLWGLTSVVGKWASARWASAPTVR